MKLCLFLTTGLLLFVLAGCGDSSFAPYKVDNITRVLYNSCNNYTVMVEDPETKIIKTISTYGPGKIIVVADAVEGQPMWMYVEPNNRYKKYTIHIYSGRSILGGKTGGKGSRQLHVID